MIGIIKYFLLIASINGIDLYMVNIEVHFYYYLIIFIGPEYFNAPKDVFYIEKMAVNQLITFNKSGII